MLSIKEVAFIGYPVTDLARARAFYEGLLGLQPGMTWGEGDTMWVEYDIGPTTLVITNFAKEWEPNKQGPAVAMEVEDFDASIAELKAAGVTFYIEPNESPVCRMAVISDPDGNSLCMHCRNAAHQH